MTDDRSLSRRHALGLAALGAGVPALAACGGGSDPGTDGGADVTSLPGSSAPDEQSSPSSAPSSRGPATPLVAAAKVPVGGGVILAAEKVVVTQPTRGEFKAFSTICTHAGCPVAEVGEDILCNCHGSRFALSDGSVLDGPASAPLPDVTVAIRSGKVVRV